MGYFRVEGTWFGVFWDPSRSLAQIFPPCRVQRTVFAEGATLKTAKEFLVRNTRSMHRRQTALRAAKQHWPCDPQKAPGTAQDFGRFQRLDGVRKSLETVSCSPGKNWPDSDQACWVVVVNLTGWVGRHRLTLPPGFQHGRQAGFVLFSNENWLEGKTVLQCGGCAHLRPSWHLPLGGIKAALWQWPFAASQGGMEQQQQVEASRRAGAVWVFAPIGLP